MAKYLSQNFHCVDIFNIFPDTIHLEFIALKGTLDVYVSIIKQLYFTSKYQVCTFYSAYLVFTIFIDI